MYNYLVRHYLFYTLIVPPTALILLYFYNIHNNGYTAQSTFTSGCFVIVLFSVVCCISLYLCCISLYLCCIFGSLFQHFVPVHFVCGWMTNEQDLNLISHHINSYIINLIRLHPEDVNTCFFFPKVFINHRFLLISVHSCTCAVGVVHRRPEVSPPKTKHKFN